MRGRAGFCVVLAPVTITLDKAMKTMKRDTLIIVGILFAIVAGGVFGYWLPEQATHLQFLGSLFFNALFVIIVPLIIASMVSGITALGNLRLLGTASRKTILYFLVTAAVATALGIALALIFKPGGESIAAAPSGALSLGEAVNRVGLAATQILEQMVPKNIIAAAAETKILALIVFSLVFGGVLTTLGSRARVVVEFFAVVNEAILKMVQLVMYLAPVGIFSIVASKVAENAGALSGMASALLNFSFLFVIGLTIHFAFLVGVLRVFGAQNPITFLRHMGPALATAFGTSSSSATLPVTMECVVDRAKIDSRAAAFVLPLGTTINMDGTAMYQAMAAIFIAQYFGAPLEWGGIVILFFTAIFAAIGAPGIPQGGVIMMTMVMGSAGLPAEIIAQGIALILVVDWLLDRFRTVINVLGDPIGAAIIANTREFKATAGSHKGLAREGAPRHGTHSGEHRQSRDDRSHRPEQRGRSERYDRNERSDRGPRNCRTDSGEQTEQTDDFGNIIRPPRHDRGERSERYDRGARSDRGGRYNRSEGANRGGRGGHGDRPHRGPSRYEDSRGLAPRRDERSAKYGDEERPHGGTENYQTMPLEPADSSQGTIPTGSSYTEGIQPSFVKETSPKETPADVRPEHSVYTSPTELSPQVEPEKNTASLVESVDEGETSGQTGSGVFGRAKRRKPAG